MKRKLFIGVTLSLLFLIPAQSNAQTINFNFSDLNEKEKIFNPIIDIEKVFDLGEHGSIAVIGYAYDAFFGGPKHPFRIFRFNTEGKLIWQKKLKPEYGAGYTSFVTTPDNTLFYAVQTVPYKMYGVKTYVDQINIADGALKNFEIEGKEDFGKSLNTIVCDNSNLYFITTEDGNERNDKKKPSEKLVLNRFDHQQLTHVKFTVSTPPIEGGEENSFWAFIGQKGDTKFFSSKHVDIESCQNDFIIIGVMPDGVVSSTIRFSAPLSKGKFTRPIGRTISEQNQVGEISKVDYTYYQTKETFGFRAHPAAYNQVIYDYNTDKLLVYGLYGYGPYRNLGSNSKYIGLFLHQFDLNGKRIWSTEKASGPGGGEVRVSTTDDQKILLTGSSEAFLFSADGKFLKSGNIEPAKTKFPLRVDVKTLFLDQNIKSKSYIKSSLKDKNGSVTALRTLVGEVLFFFSNKDKVFQTIFFKN